MKTPTPTTVVYLRDDEGRICLAQKKKDIHHEGGVLTKSLGTWNGYGGKKEVQYLTIEDTAIRELFDESTVFAQKADLVFCGRVMFFWPENETDIGDMDVSFYFLDTWQGSPSEGKEMGPPSFFEPRDIPYNNMMSGDWVLLPRMLRGEMAIGKLYLGKKDAQERTLFVPS